MISGCCKAETGWRSHSSVSDSTCCREPWSPKGLDNCALPPCCPPTAAAHLCGRRLKLPQSPSATGAGARRCPTSAHVDKATDDLTWQMKRNPNRDHRAVLNAAQPTRADAASYWFQKTRWRKYPLNGTCAFQQQPPVLVPRLAPLPDAAGYCGSIFLVFTYPSLRQLSGLPE